MARRKREQDVEDLTIDTSATAGQSGDDQGLSQVAETDSQSVAELADEGQSYEAAAVEAVENAPDADVAEVTTRQVPEDDVPSEYLGRDQDQ